MILFVTNRLHPLCSRRDYTYLPNGQLGKIVSRSVSGAAYNTTIRYDHAGLPVTVSSGSDSYELFWDEQSRLIDMVVTKQPVINTGIFTVRWHYHYLGTTLLAATREVEQGTYDTSGAYRAIYRNGWTVKRFCVVADERGLPHRMLDEQGAGDRQDSRHSAFPKARNKLHKTKVLLNVCAWWRLLTIRAGTSYLSWLRRSMEWLQQNKLLPLTTHRSSFITIWWAAG